MSKQLIAQIIAIIIIISNILCNQSTKKKNVLSFNAFGNMLSALQYVLLGAYTGCISCLVAVIRNLVFASYKDKKIPLYVLLVYWVIAIGLNIPFYKGWISIIPVFNICLYGYAIWQSNMKFQKKATILIGGLGIVFDFTNKAYVTVLNELVDIISCYVGYIKIKKEEKNKRKRRKKKN